MLGDGRQYPEYGPQCAPCGVVHATAAEVSRIRLIYIRKAVLRIKQMAAVSDVDTRLAARELERYLQWVKHDLPYDERQPVWVEMQALPR